MIMHHKNRKKTKHLLLIIGIKTTGGWQTTEVVSI